MDTIINKMASDLGVYRFNEETTTNFECRVIYSAMASWIKAITMDKPVGSKEEGLSGVSKRHIYERGRAIFESFIKMFPEISYWFNIATADVHPVILLRDRLINHGDLLNEGFVTNLTLSFVHSTQLSSCYETVYGEILGKDIVYSGISTIRNSNKEIIFETGNTVTDWLTSFIKTIWWAPLTSDTEEWMYFDPTHSTKNNYSAWRSSISKDYYGIVLARMTINRNGYEYYLLKPKNNLVHKIDSFLQEQGDHIRIMYALRKIANNSVIATINHHGDHVYLKLYAHLPTKERIMLESYAWPENHINDKLCWIMYDYIWNYIKPHFEMIGIQIVEEMHG